MPDDGRTGVVRPSGPARDPPDLMPIKLCECGCGEPAPIAKITNTKRGHISGQPCRFIYGHNLIKHLAYGTPEYKAYWNARQRCTDPKLKCFADYGGRGIKFLFTSFEQFFAELGPRPDGMTLDRKDNDGNYEPGNVRWATRQQQYHNRRNTL